MTDLRTTVSGLRTEINAIGDNVRALQRREDFLPEERVTKDMPAAKAEMHANVMLAFRHLEDARMRLGKVLQAFDGGVSCYDK